MFKICYLSVQLRIELRERVTVWETEDLQLSPLSKVDSRLRDSTRKAYDTAPEVPTFPHYDRNRDVNGHKNVRHIHGYDRCREDRICHAEARARA